MTVTNCSKAMEDRLSEKLTSYIPDISNNSSSQTPKIFSKSYTCKTIISIWPVYVRNEYSFPIVENASDAHTPQHWQMQSGTQLRIGPGFVCSWEFTTEFTTLLLTPPPWDLAVLATKPTTQDPAHSPLWSRTFRRCGSLSPWPCVRGGETGTGLCRQNPVPPLGQPHPLPLHREQPRGWGKKLQHLGQACSRPACPSAGSWGWWGEGAQFGLNAAESGSTAELRSRCAQTCRHQVCVWLGRWPSQYDSCLLVFPDTVLWGTWRTQVRPPQKTSDRAMALCPPCMSEAFPYPASLASQSSCQPPKGSSSSSHR